MSDHGFAANEQYARQQVESAKATVLPFYGMAQQGLQAAVDWQKFMLDTAVRESMNLVEVHKAMLDAAARQSCAFVGAAQQQFEDLMAVCASLSQRWLEEVRTIQNRFSGEVCRAIQETPIPRPAKKAEIPHRGSRRPEWDRIEREWDQYGDKVHDRWRELSDEALESSRGTREELARALQQTYAMSQDEAYEQLDGFLEYVGERRPAHLLMA
jgi:uncharacterized protein YjbJ (UPF0337 family)